MWSSWSPHPPMGVLITVMALFQLSSPVVTGPPYNLERASANIKALCTCFDKSCIMH